MKRLLCLLLTGAMLFASVACAANMPERKSEVPGETASPETPDPNDELPIELPILPIENPTSPPIELTDPVEPLFPPEMLESVEGYGDFSDLLSSAILTGTRNQNLSPISVYLALAMAAEGAKGETQAELLTLLGCKDLEELSAVCGGMLETLQSDDEGSTLELSNSLWTAKEIGGTPVTFHAEYLKKLADVYRSEATAVDFGTESATKQISDWIIEKTHEKIVPSQDAMSFDADTIAVLVNAIYLKDRWQEAFLPEQTETGTFYGLNGKTDVDYMYRFDKKSSVRRGDGWLAYRVRLARLGYVTFVLPDEDVSLESLLGSPDAIRSLLHDGEEKRYDVSVKIPKFKFQDRMELAEVLKALGARISFSGAADFSGMTDARCRFDRVLQESFIGVDENGVEAAAYTIISMKTTSFDPTQLEKLEFHLTRPFFYAIESNDGTVLFIGTVTEPTPAGQN